MAKNVFTLKLNKRELSVAETKLKTLIQKANDIVSLDAAKRLYKDIDASGNVPFDTGNLKADTVVFKNKRYKNYAAIGWWAPYAQKMYYGVHGEKVFKTINGKRMSFATSSTGNGIPFWDKPFTSNTQYMMRIYEWAYRKSNLGRYIER